MLSRPPSAAERRMSSIASTTVAGLPGVDRRHCAELGRPCRRECRTTRRPCAARSPASGGRRRRATSSASRPTLGRSSPPRSSKGTMPPKPSRGLWCRHRRPEQQRAQRPAPTCRASMSPPSQARRWSMSSPHLVPSRSVHPAYRSRSSTVMFRRRRTGSRAATARTSLAVQRPAIVCRIRASAAATGFSVPSDRSLTITGIGSVPRPNTAAANGAKRSRSGQMTMTSSGRSDGSATNRWPRASRNTSSWRIVPWQAWTWMLVSDDGLTNGVGGRSAWRSARTWASNDAVRPGAAASTTASATTAAAKSAHERRGLSVLGVPTSAAADVCRPAIRCRRAGCARLAGSRSMGGVRSQATAEGWSRDTCTSRPWPRPTSTSSWPRDKRADAEQLDGRRKRRAQLVASQLLDPLRDLLGRARGADPLAEPGTTARTATAWTAAACRRCARRQRPRRRRQRSARIVPSPRTPRCHWRRISGRVVA